jgi:YD repeat-containing protein
VRFKFEATPAAIDELLAKESARHGRRLRGAANVEILNLLPGMDVEQASKQLSKSELVEFCEPDFVIAKDEVHPNDPRFAEQWALAIFGFNEGRFGSDLGVTQAWETTTGAAETIIAVVDSGIDFTHPDLRANQWHNPAEKTDGRDDNLDGYVDDHSGWDFITERPAITDVDGHGTAMAGLIAAEGNDSVGVSGVMWRAGLMSLRVLDQHGEGDVASAVEAIDYAVAHGAQVINLSWGLDYPSIALFDAIYRAGQHGVLVVSAAGNQGRYLKDNPHFPAAFNLSNLIAVAGLTANDQLASWSNYAAETVSLAAPGEKLLTTKTGGDYVFVSGTSAAAALVSGVAGLLRTQRPWLSAERTKELLVQHTRGLLAAEGRVSTGGLNARQSVTALTTLLPLEGLTHTPGMNGGARAKDKAAPLPQAGKNSLSRQNNPQIAVNTPGDVQPGIPDLPNLTVLKNTHPAAPVAPATGLSPRRHPRTGLTPRGNLRFGDPIPTPSPLPSPSPIPSPRPSVTPSVTPSVLVALSASDMNATDGILTRQTKAGGPRPDFNEDSAAGLVEATFNSSTRPPSFYWLEDWYQYVYQAALACPSSACNNKSTEDSYWHDILRKAYQSGTDFSARILAARELGRTLLESTNYLGRNRTDHWYVYDLYQVYLNREPDAGGWAFWEGLVPTFGREAVRRAFDECDEFRNIVNALTPGTSSSGNQTNVEAAKIDTLNAPGGNGVNPISRNFSWSLPLLGLPGRAGLDLGVGLSYNSAVWVKSGPYTYFDEDNGTPGPGFRIGFPTVQEQYFNAETGKVSYLFLTPGGSRVELRRTANSSAYYEAADSSYLQLIDNGGSLLINSADGTQMTYVRINNEWRCTQVKNSNGNYLSVNYNSWGQITTITDTLGRVVTFIYDGNQHLSQIKQNWNGTDHVYATFYYDNIALTPNFSGFIIVGAGTTAWPMLNQVTLDDGSFYQFSYNGLGQISNIQSYAAATTLLNSTTLTFDTATGYTDRISKSTFWARRWNYLNGIEQSADTLYDTPVSAGWNPGYGTGSDGTGQKVRVTLPDSTKQDIYFYTSGWRRGLAGYTETLDTGGALRRKTSTIWTQDIPDPNYKHKENPRVAESNVADPEGNRKRTTSTYGVYGLVADVREYAADATTVYRRSHIDYLVSSVTPGQTYFDKRIIGLPEFTSLYEGDGAKLIAKSSYSYDWGAEHLTDIIVSNSPVNVVQHDRANYGPGFIAGRGNLCRVERFEVNNNGNFTGQVTESKVGYNITGETTFTRANGPNGWRQVFLDYTDSFSDSVNRNTYAYLTKVKDEDNYESFVQYDFNHGGVTREQSPPPEGPNGTYSQGSIVTRTYDTAGRPDRITNTATGAYKRYEYVPSDIAVKTYTTVRTANASDEFYATQTLNGLGQVVSTSSELPHAANRYVSQTIEYDKMGRAFKQSNPLEVDGSWQAAGDDAPNNNGPGWKYRTQTFDWKGRPLVSTNVDNTTAQASYGGCGCAGGAVVTATDEIGRRQRITYDVFGRVKKSEILTLVWDDKNGQWVDGAYSTTANSYNVRDQILSVKVHAGDETGAFQETTIGYDGYGRRNAVHAPEMATGQTQTFAYNPDDTVLWTKDARQAKTTYGYNGRGLVTSLTYDVSATSPSVTAPANVTFQYDPAGNRKQMDDSFGTVTYRYDRLSRLTTETRNFTPLGQSYTIGYEYNASGQLTKLTEPSQFGGVIDYGYDKAGRLTGVTDSGTPYGGVADYASDLQYRAWGALKQIKYGAASAPAFTASLNFNARLQTSHYQLTKNATNEQVMNKDYSYYSDGRLQQSTDLTDNNLNRNYSYDGVTGRLTGASSGTSYSSSYSGPFHYNFSYDVWGNTTSSSIRTGWQSYGGFYFPSWSDTSYNFSNNKRQQTGWSYDTDGRLLTSREGTQNWGYSFDGAGQMLSSTAPNRTLGLGYDGDGVRLQFTENGTTTYYLRSSVLGRQAVMELDVYGQKVRGYVYAGGSILAKQENNAVSWDQRDLSGVSTRMTKPDGTVNSRVELDPLGTVINPNNVAPIAVPGNSNWNNNQTGFYGDPQRPDMGCTMDQVPIPCDMARQQLQSGAAVQCPPQGCGVRGVAVTNPVTGQTTNILVQFNASAAAAGFGLGAALGQGNILVGSLPAGSIYTGNGNWVGGTLPQLSGRTEIFRDHYQDGILGTIGRAVSSSIWQPLSDCFKTELRPIFGNLVDQVSISPNSNVPAVIEKLGTGPKGVGAVTFRNTIYLPQSANLGALSTFLTIFHELVHVQQFRKYGTNGFVQKYFQGYIDQIRSQIPQDLRNEFNEAVQGVKNGVNFDTLGTVAAAWVRLNNVIEKLLANMKNLDLESAYLNIPLEKEAYKKEAEFRKQYEFFKVPCGLKNDVFP